MEKLRLLHRLVKQAWKTICQQFWLLAVLSMLFWALPMAAGPVAEALLSQGVDFSGLRFAVCAPEGDGTGALVEELTGRMRDVSRYASFHSMTYEEAAAQLEEGALTAVLVLPDDFLAGVLNGTNPDLTLIVSGKTPLEELLALWVGQSAADLLTSAQEGIYAVLDAYPAEEIPGLSWEQVKTDINLRYISMTLNRQELFRHRQLSATGSMDMATHYGLSLIVFLVMALPPVLCPLYSDAGTAFRRRLLSLGHGAAVQYTGPLFVSFWVLLLVTGAPVLVLTRWNWAGCAVLSLFAATFASVCCLATRSASGCGGLAFPAAAAALFLSGGLLPTPLLPPALQTLGAFSPAGMLRTLMYLEPSKWSDRPEAVLGIGGWILGLGLLGLLFYRCRLRKGDA